ncbi:DUF2291 family protein [Tropicimonas sp. IMCC6043]|uniref:DUF2291 family protein n=1 Tax=Tropicimonas sp. IMCC6043 TaxID=2510645 RepID=UPI00101BB04A|nr:DUF2291 domain-containing protein [Tropicimonas sp. IMCC6043]RYH07718.1 DUF2291 domain-containing protein [Tropicimonas sp. IMCC6043]
MAATDSNARRASSSGRTRWILGAVIVLVLGAIAFDTKVVTIGGEEDLRQQAFNPDRYGTEQFPRIRDDVVERAPDAAQLATELAEDKKATMAKYGTPTSIGAVMPVTFTGVVGEGKSGIFDVSVAGLPEGSKVRVQTGPAINGTDLRDFPGDIAFGQFKNQIEFQNAGSGINRAMAAEVLDGLDRDALPGKTVTVSGVFNLINPKNWLVTPVAFEVQG